MSWISWLRTILLRAKLLESATVCPECQGTGKVMDAFPCSTCLGRGFRVNYQGINLRGKLVMLITRIIPISQLRYELLKPFFYFVRIADAETERLARDICPPQYLMGVSDGRKLRPFHLRTASLVITILGLIVCFWLDWRLQAFDVCVWTLAISLLLALTANWMEEPVPFYGLASPELSQQFMRQGEDFGLGLMFLGLAIFLIWSFSPTSAWLAWPLKYSIVVLLVLYMMYGSRQQLEG